ncbi:hypothetical protein Tco_0489163 [Tanacetum coccineum]
MCGHTQDFLEYVQKIWFCPGDLTRDCTRGIGVLLDANRCDHTIKICPSGSYKVTEEELNALLDDSKPSSTTSEKISESFLDHEFEEFMADEIKEIPEKKEEFENSFEVLPLEGNQRIKNSILDPPTNLVMKPLPEHLEYAFLEKDSLPPVVISTLLQDDEKKHLVSILKETQRSICLENIRYSRNYPISGLIGKSLNTTISKGLF